LTASSIRSENCNRCQS